MWFGSRAVLYLGALLAVAATTAQADSLLGLTIGHPDVSGNLMFSYDKDAQTFSSIVGFGFPGYGPVSLTANIGNDGHQHGGTLSVDDGSGPVFVSNDLVAFGTGENQAYEFEFRQESGSGAVPGTLIAVHLFGVDVVNAPFDPLNPIPNGGSSGAPDFTVNFQSGLSSFDAGRVAPTPSVALGGLVMLGSVVVGRVTKRRGKATE